jgi:hypothetical protein
VPTHRAGPGLKYEQSDKGIDFDPFNLSFLRFVKRLPYPLNVFAQTGVIDEVKNGQI